jgi:Xaa-Pro aminopeptidase
MPVRLPRPLAAFAAVVLAAASAARAQQPAAPAQYPPQPYIEELPGMGRPIDTAATAARRARLLDRLGDAVVIIPASRGRNLETDYIQDNDFRQSNTFFYFTQLEQPSAWILMSAHATEPDSVVLLLPDRNPQMERWTGPKLGPGPLAVQLTGFRQALSVTRLDSIVTALQARRVPVYVPVDRYAQGLAPLDRLRADSSVTFRNLRPVVDSMRVVKDAAELAALRRATDITAEGHRQVISSLRPGMFEYEIEAVLEGTFRRLGADRVGFPSIVGSGPYSTVLHYDVNRRRTNPGDLVVVDIGAEYAQYTADVTRTYPVSGTFTPRQKALYELVLGTNQAVIDSVRPGITLGRLGQIARDHMRTHSADLCAPRTCEVYLIHGIAHHIGMDVHDVGPGNLPLVPGMVFTDEPGIYIPDEALGIRIEDDVLVTPTGHEVLSAGAPKTVAEIERMMQRPAAQTRRPGREE